jgi:hypothetical protein
LGGVVLLDIEGGKQMKLRMRLMSMVVGLCFLGASGEAALADGCGDGVLQNETFNGNLVVSDEFSCSIISSVIQGNLRVRDTANVLLLNNKVGGSIRVIRTEGMEGDGIANVIANTVFTGNLVVSEYDTANVIENETLLGNIRVIGNTSALVQKNISGLNLNCRGNTVLDSFLNFAKASLNCE